MCQPGPTPIFFMQNSGPSSSPWRGHARPLPSTPSLKFPIHSTFPISSIRKCQKHPGISTHEIADPSLGPFGRWLRCCILKRKIRNPLNPFKQLDAEARVRSSSENLSDAGTNYIQLSCKETCRCIRSAVLLL